MLTEVSTKPEIHRSKTPSKIVLVDDMGPVFGFRHVQGKEVAMSDLGAGQYHVALRRNPGAGGIIDFGVLNGRQIEQQTVLDRSYLHSPEQPRGTVYAQRVFDSTRLNRQRFEAAWVGCFIEPAIP